MRCPACLLWRPLMDKLVRGLADFIRRKRPRLQATFRRLAHGQNPVALLLACSDSRIVSSLLFTWSGPISMCITEPTGDSSAWTKT